MKKCVWTWGRFQPPNYGHRLLFKKISDIANNDDWFIFTSKTYDKKRNPLQYYQKLSWLHLLCPEVKNHVVEDIDIKTYLQAASYLYNQGYTHCTFVAGTDEIQKMSKPLNDYNGIVSKHGYYNFDQITFAESVSPPEHSSDARLFAKENNIDEFMRVTGITDKTTANCLISSIVL